MAVVRSFVVTTVVVSGWVVSDDEIEMLLLDEEVSGIDVGLVSVVVINIWVVGLVDVVIGDV